MSSNDNIARSFDAIPKLSGKEYFVMWKQMLNVTLLLTRSNSYLDPKTKPPKATPLEAWTERDNQAAVAILSTISESILSAYIYLLSDAKTEAPRSRTIYDSLVKQSAGVTNSRTGQGCHRDFLRAG
jgi:hypothetical protein